VPAASRRARRGRKALRRALCFIIFIISLCYKEYGFILKIGTCKKKAGIFSTVARVDAMSVPFYRPGWFGEKSRK